MRSSQSRLGLVSFAALIVLAAAQLGASCVDGVTPDCSDPAVCAPGATGTTVDAAADSDAALGFDANIGTGDDAGDASADADGG
jgi:citrate lyase beta subunit